jgi:four helix bundle protein
MGATFNHEKLDVYHRALAFCGQMDSLVQGWNCRHAFCGHLVRAAESVVENLAEASAAHSGVKFSAMDNSLGSALECAACLDIALIKEMLGKRETRAHKEELCDIFKMLMGLKKSWLQTTARDDSGDYRTGGDAEDDQPLFHHERLNVYGMSLDIVRWLCETAAEDTLPAPRFKKLDAAATGIPLNIAEGNARFSNLDHCRFLEMAHRSTIKMAAQLDMCVQRGQFDPDIVDVAKGMLGRTAAMTAAMMRKR